MHPNFFWLLLLMAFISGAVMPLQAGINGQLAREISCSLAAATISSIIGTIVLLLLMLFQRENLNLGGLKSLAWWHWSGGLMGAFFGFTAALAAPCIGALLFMASVLAGQMSS